MSLELNKPLLVLDLDETLVSSVSATRAAALGTLRLPHTLIEVENEPDKLITIAVFKRPFLESFLTHTAQHYRLAVWSAGKAPYVHAVINRVIRPATFGVKFEFIWTSYQCEQATDHGLEPANAVQRYVKNLATIGEPTLARVVLVDNSAWNAQLQPANHVAVPDFCVMTPDAWHDNCLPDLAEFLEQLSRSPDVRGAKKDWWHAAPTTPPPPPPPPPEPTARGATDEAVAAALDSLPPIVVYPATVVRLPTLTARRDWRLQRHHKRRSFRRARVETMKQQEV